VVIVATIDISHTDSVQFFLWFSVIQYIVVVPVVHEIIVCS